MPADPSPSTAPHPPQSQPVTEPRRGLLDRVPFLGEFLGRSEAPALAAAPAPKQIGRDKPE